MTTDPLRFTPLSLSLAAILLLTPAIRSAGKISNLSPVEKEFIQDEAKAGEVLFTIASEAASRGESDEVRSFARTVVDEHEKARAELSKLAAAKEVKLEPSAADLKNREDRLNSIRILKEEAFDRAFLSLVIDMHTDSIENFEKTSTDSPDIDLKRWAAGMLPVLKAHLERATTLSSVKTVSGRKPNLIVL